MKTEAGRPRIASRVSPARLAERGRIIGMLGLTAAGFVIRAASPMAYCDHFALRKIAADQALSARLGNIPGALWAF